MKTLFLILFLTLYSFGNAQDAKSLLLLYGENNNRKVDEYKWRVENMSGNIVDFNLFKKQINEIKKYKYTVALWVSANGGIKTNEDTVEILFDYARNDLNSIGNVGPLLISDTTYNSNALQFLGDNSLQSVNFSIPTPFTLVVAIRQSLPLGNETILSSGLNDKFAISVNKKNELIVTCSNKFNSGSLEDGKNIIIVENDCDSVSVFINNHLATKVKSGYCLISGLNIGMNSKNKPDYFSGYLYECGIFHTIISDKFRGELYKLLK